MKNSIVSALMILSGLGLAQAQTLPKLHPDMRHDRYPLRQAAQNGDRNRARHELHQVRRDERRLDRRDGKNNYYLQRNNNWNRPYYNHHTFYRYNRYRTYP